RDLAKGKAAVSNLNQNIDVVQLDVTDEKSIQEAVKFVTDKYGKLDILINNAGAVFDNRKLPSEITQDSLRDDFNLNFFGLIAVTQAFLPLLK
ncbi:SDR family NAD(P)-dependent oxidoreductase, partial [Lactobacillus salivarius]|nr:SDR family NAD(P)-dependent oxidoreductase [Ligilactobacillus salivarius]